MNQKIFRKVSLDRLSSPEQLDTLMTITSPRSWISLVALLLIIASAILWAFMGTISIRVPVQGVLINDREKLEAVIYIPIQEGRKVVSGMEVQLNPIGVSKEEYGFLLGEISYLDQTPATQESMKRTLVNEELVKFFAGSGVVLESRVEMISDPDTPSGYLWSSKQGADMELISGILCEGNIITERIQPIKLFLPFLNS